MEKDLPKPIELKKAILKVVETQGFDDCKECVLQPYCMGDCPLEIQKHYEL